MRQTALGEFYIFNGHFFLEDLLEEGYLDLDGHLDILAPLVGSVFLVNHIENYEIN